MNALKKFLVIVRPVQVLTATAATIVVASISVGHLLLTTTVVAAAIQMGLLVLASSILHCALQRHDEPYTRRVNDYVELRHRHLWAGTGFLIWASSTFASIFFVPFECVLVSCAALSAVAYYTGHRGTNAPLNSLVGLICTTPVFVGWLAAGAPLSWPPAALVVLTFWHYYLREEVKDHQERQTIALRSWLDGGPNYQFLSGALVCTGAMLFLPTMMLVDFFSDGPPYPGWFAVPLFIHYGVFCYLAFVAGNRRLYPQGVMTGLTWSYMVVGMIGIGAF